MKFEFYGKKIDVRFKKDTYVSTKNLYVGLDYYDEECGEYLPFADVTVNLGSPLMPGFAYLDTCNTPGLEEWLVENELGLPTGMSTQSGFCVFPLFAFDMDVLDRVISEADAS